MHESYAYALVIITFFVESMTIISWSFPS